MNKIELRPTEDQTDLGCIILVGQDILSGLGTVLDYARFTRALIVADANVPSRFLTAITKSLPLPNQTITMMMGEENKNLASVERIWRALHELGCDRKSLVINVGGGVIGDVGGFAASTYMRGIDFMHVPTTVASQSDAAIGGKTGVNLGGIKNLVGAFRQPVAVVIDVDTLATLPQREFVSGFGEVIKHGLIQDRTYFALATAKQPREFSTEELIELLDRSCLIKANVVVADEKEAGMRRILNFGHTVGHAVESLSYETAEPLLHGEAVSIGMVAEAHMSVLVGLLTAKECSSVIKGLAEAGLPTSIPRIDIDAMIEKMKPDKKNEGGKLNFTLLHGIGRAVYNQRVPQEAIRQALEYIVN